MRRRSRLEGPNRLRRTLRRIPRESRRELSRVVESAAKEIERDALGLVPVNEGDLAQSITYKLASDKLTAVIGPGMRTAELVRRKAGSPFARSPKVRLSAARKHDLFQFVKGYWLEFGTKGTDRSGPIQRVRFMSRAYERNERRIRRAVSKAIDRALKRASGDR